MPRVNYVIACWMGPRMSEDARQVQDRSFFLRTHLARLSELKHQLDQITVVLATGGEPTHEAYATGLTQVGDTPVVVLSRPNECYSYGSWEHAFVTFGDAFTHYIFIEDDYIPCFDDFDRQLVDISKKKKAYVCSLHGWQQTHAAISNSIVASSILQNVLPTQLVNLVRSIPQSSRGYYSQIIWSKGFCESGYPIEDWTDTNSSPYWTGSEIRWYGHPSLMCLLVPIQAVGHIVNIVDGRTRLVGALDMNGRVAPVHPADIEMWNGFLATDLNDQRWNFPS